MTGDAASSMGGPEDLILHSGHPAQDGDVITPMIYPDSDSTFVIAQPLTPQCARHLRSREHACLGISPFNSYFTEAQIRRLARWAFRTFSTVHFFVPDAAAAHTLEALGYPAKKAAAKARRQGQYLLNKIRRALACLGISRPDELILDSRALTTNTRYTQLLADAEHRFHTDPTFAEQLLDASRWVLDKRLPTARSRPSSSCDRRCATSSPSFPCSSTPPASWAAIVRCSATTSQCRFCTSSTRGS